MTTFDHVRINQLSPEGTAWLEEVISILDAKDVDAYTSYLADDVDVLFNNGEMAMHGRDNVREGLRQFWAGFGTLEHDELNIYGTDDHLVHEALNHYTTLDGRQVTVRAVAWLDRDNSGQITSMRIYSDQSPVFSDASVSAG